MNIVFLPVEFKIKYNEPTIADVNPAFVLRSILGMNLRKICCMSRKSTCPECMYNQTCSYAYIFESIHNQDNKVLPGTNRLSHPFSFTENTRVQKNEKLLEYSFTITLFGNTVNFLPYIYAAFVRAGQNGMFKSRTSFSVEDVLINQKSILVDNENLRRDYKTPVFQYNFENSEKNKEGEFLIELKSPLRFKTNGKYSIDFQSNDFMRCLSRRVKTIFQLYGEISPDEVEKLNFETELNMTDKNLHWFDYSHWSSRQQNAMELGGVIGTFKLVGNYSELELALLEFNRIANAGKNTNFGLGQIDYWKK